MVVGALLPSTDREVAGDARHVATPFFRDQRRLHLRARRELARATNYGTPIDFLPRTIEITGLPCRLQHLPPYLLLNYEKAQTGSSIPTVHRALSEAVEKTDGYDFNQLGVNWIRRELQARRSRRRRDLMRSDR